MEKDFYKRKKVLVTGADGFIGSHLVEKLVELGASVRAFCYYNSFGSWGWLDHSEKKGQFEVVLGDIRDSYFVQKALRNVEIVFHLAALIAIPYSYLAYRSFFETNVMGTINVLEASLKNGVERVVHTSTSEVYGTPDLLPIKEEHPLKGQSPYSASKIAADKACESFYRSFGLPVVILRPFNTYGPRQSMRAVIPTILCQLLSGKRKIKLGNLKPKRDLLYVSDTVDGFIKAGMKNGIEGEVIQLGTNKTYSIEEIALKAIEIFNPKAEICVEAKRFRPEKSEVMVLISDPKKAYEILNWKHTVELEEGLIKTGEWIKKNLSFYKPTIYQL